MATSISEFQVGDEVKVIAESDGWGSHVTAGDIGVVSQIYMDSNALRVDFPNHEGWYGRVSCFEKIANAVDTTGVLPELRSILTDVEKELVGTVVDKICDRLPEIPSTYLEKVVKLGLKHKTRLNDILGESHVTNGLRTVLDLEASEDDWIEDVRNWALKQAILRYFPVESIECHKNSVTLRGSTQPQRLTKVIMKDLAKYRLTHPFRTWMQENYADKKEGEYGQFLGEMLSSKRSGKVIVISTNAFDYITSSGRYWNLASFSSCHNYDGCHFSGNFSYINDAITLIAYVAPADRLDYKEGRSWVYLPESIDCVVQPKSYGSFNEVQRKQVREYLERKIEEYRSWGKVSWSARNVDNWHRRECCTAAYFDSGCVRFAYPIELKPSYKTTHPFLQFDEAICPECGNRHTNAENGVCEDCDGGDRCCCSDCGDRGYEDDGHYSENGHWYCDHCYHNIFTNCYDCGREMDIENDSLFEVNGHDYCERCFDRRFATCEDCGAVVPNGDIASTSEGDFCESCCKEHGLSRCEDCGEWVEEDTLVKIEDTDEFVCADCAESWYPCSECGKVFSEWADDELELCSCCIGAEDSDPTEATLPIEKAVTCDHYSNQLALAA